MKLSTFLKKKNLKPSKWAIKNGMCPATVLKYLAGGTVSARTVLRMYYASGKRVDVLTILRAIAYNRKR